MRGHSGYVDMKLDIRVPGELQQPDRATRGVLVPMPARIGDDDGNEAEICSVSSGRLDADFHGQADDRDRPDAAVTKCEGQRRSFERGHRNLVEDGLALKRRQLRDELEAWRVAQEPWPHVVGAVDTLPAHRHPKLERTHELARQGQVPREAHAHPGFARDGQHVMHTRRESGAIRHLADDADLHVVHEQRHVAGIADIVKRARGW